MKILVDADSCPKPARELVLRTAKKRELRAIFAANRLIPGVRESGGEMLLCPEKQGAADDRILLLAEPGDLALTRDIPLASRLVAASILVIDDRGSVYTPENIRERLGMRNFTVDLAENGILIERIPSYGKKELKAFADSLDRIITRLLRKSS